MKDKCNKYFAGIFLALLIVLCIGTLISSAKSIGAFMLKSFPAQASDMNYEEAASVFTQTIEDNVQNYAFANDYFIDIYGLTQVVIGRNMIYGDSLYKDNNGFLQGMYEELDIAPYADKLVQLDKWLKNEEVGFCYVQAPSRYIPGYSECPDDFINYTNENSAELLAVLESENVTCFDASKLLKTGEYPLENTFYKTDTHWTTNFCLYTYSQAMQEINEKYELGIDEKVYNTDNYNIETLEDNFLGSIGIVTSKFFTGLDDYSIITPSFDTDLEFTHYDGEVIKEQKSGSFEEVLLYPSFCESEWGRSYSTRSYDTYLKTIYTEKVIKNSEGNGKKLMIVCDSYGMPFSAFASLGFSETHIIDCRYGEITDGIYNYLEEYEPDMVIMLLSTTTYKQIDWSNFE